MSESVDFLQRVYGKEDGYVDLPSKVNGRWIPWVVQWPAATMCERRISSCLDDGEDLYFSVAQFTEGRRREEYVRNPRWLWADLDGVDPERECGGIGLLPTIAWSSSPGRYQALWRLKQRLSPELHGRLNRALTYAVGADTGGWDITQVLRIPGTKNFKYGDNGNAPPVTLLWDNRRVYDARKVFARLTKLGAVMGAADAPSGSPSVTLSVGGDAGGDLVAGLPRRAQRLLKATESVVGERSDRMWELLCLLVEAGLSDEHVLGLAGNSVWNKWVGRKDWVRHLGREVRRARRHVESKMSNDYGPLRLVEEIEDEHQVRQSVEEDRGRTDRLGNTSQTTDADGETSVARLPWESYEGFLGKHLEAPRWLVKDIWTAGSHGIIGGEPKTSKSTLGFALAMAVASGQPFLGIYDVGVSGPVLVVQEENPPWLMQDRMRKIAHSMGLLEGETHVLRGQAREGLLGTREVTDIDFPSEVPLKILNNWGFDMTIEDHREALEATIAEMRPAFILLDSLYLMLGGVDENISSQLRPFLRWLMYLRYTYNCAIAVIHHYRKAQVGSSAAPRAGQRLMGSATLHAWVDTAIYMEAVPMPYVEDVKSSAPLRVKMEREFRAMEPQAPLMIDLRIGKPGDLTFSTEVNSYAREGIKFEDLIRGLCATMGREDSSGWVKIADICEQSGLDRRTVVGRLAQLGDTFEVRGGQGRGVSYRVRLKREAQATSEGQGQHQPPQSAGTTTVKASGKKGKKDSA